MTKSLFTARSTSSSTALPAKSSGRASEAFSLLSSHQKDPETQAQLQTYQWVRRVHPIKMNDMPDSSLRYPLTFSKFKASWAWLFSVRVRPWLLLKVETSPQFGTYLFNLSAADWSQRHREVESLTTKSKFKMWYIYPKFSKWCFQIIFLSNAVSSFIDSTIVQAINEIFIHGQFVKGWPRKDLDIERIQMKLDFAKFASHVLKQFGTGGWSQDHREEKDALTTRG